MIFKGTGSVYKNFGTKDKFIRFNKDGEYQTNDAKEIKLLERIGFKSDKFKEGDDSE